MLKQKGITILLTTHYIEEAQSICDRVALISNGRASEVNTPDNMISRLGSYTVDIYDGITTKSYSLTQRKRPSVLRETYRARPSSERLLLKMCF